MICSCNIIHLNGFIATGEDIPQLGELLTNILEKYAVHWEDLGRKLGLENYQLDNISENNVNRQSRRVQTCCREVLEIWLREITSPTWGKLDDAIKSLPTGPISTGHKPLVTDQVSTSNKGTVY